MYLSFLGGGCPLLSEAITDVVSVHWTDLIAHFRLVTLRVAGLGPLTVGIDAHGNSLYDTLHDAMPRPGCPRSWPGFAPNGRGRHDGHRSPGMGCCSTSGWMDPKARHGWCSATRC